MSIIGIRKTGKVVNGMELNQIGSYMTTDEICEAWDEILNYAGIILDAVETRLEDMEYDEDEYEDGSDDEIEKLLEKRETLQTVLGI